MHYLELLQLLKREWDYETKWGMRLVAEASWQPLLEAAAALPHTPQHELGMRACLLPDRRALASRWGPGAGV